jgi:hypothetical protein
MAEIPPVKPTDPEDVVWGLQTADTLWQRGERIDALVWLRRAAQAAGDGNDDDRALELARYAAELTELMNRELEAAEADAEELTGDDLIEEEDIEVVGDAPTGATPMRPPASDESAKIPSVPPAADVHAGMFDPWAEMSSKLPDHSIPPEPEPPPPPPHLPADDEVITSVRPNAALSLGSQPPGGPGSQPAGLTPPERSSRPSYGMKAASPVPSAPPKPPPPRPSAPSAPKPRLPKPSVPNFPAAKVEPTIEFESPKSVEPEPEMPVLEMSVAPDPSVSPEPEDSYRESEPPLSEPSALAPEEALPGLGGLGPADVEPPPPSLARLLEGEEEPLPPLEQEPEPEQTQAQTAIPSIPPAKVLDLEPVEAFSDLPDDAREAFAAAGTIHELNEGEEIATFALAYVLEGNFDVAATMVDAPAGRLETGAVMRSRGTTEENVPVRLIAANGPGVVATWSDQSVEEAFRTIPWVEEDLRAAADKMQTLVGITIGPLGERLDQSIREQVISKLKMRTLIPSEIIVNKGETVPGLLLVGIGELELVKGDEVTGVVGSGEFLFPTEVLGMGDAPLTARAGKGGALVMFGDRGVAQELLVTCPPLLEVFAGM